MSLRLSYKEKIETLHREYLTRHNENPSLELEIRRAEIAESVYNSNAIENSTLSLGETESILFDGDLKSKLKLREVNEAQNLAKLSEMAPIKTQEDLLQAHKMLLLGISDEIAGRYRKKGENVKIVNHVAPIAEAIPNLMDQLFRDYQTNHRGYFLENIIKFHLDFELIHPFCDGNGRIGRVMVNGQLEALGFPPVIIRNSDKKKYYSAFRQYKASGKTNEMDKIITLALLEAFHKRLAYLQGKKIITLSQWVRQKTLSPSATFNAAKRQTIRAFRMNETWMIGEAL